MTDQDTRVIKYQGPLEHPGKLWHGALVVAASPFCYYVERKPSGMVEHVYKLIPDGEIQDGVWHGKWIHQNSLHD